MSASSHYFTSMSDHRVRLRTLINLRWIAVLGQASTLIIASFVLALRLELGLCFLAVGSLAIANGLFSPPVKKRRKPSCAISKSSVSIAAQSLSLWLAAWLSTLRIGHGFKCVEDINTAICMGFSRPFDHSSQGRAAHMLIILASPTH